MDTTQADKRTPAWAWAIFLAPVLILLCITVAFYVTGHRHATALSESLVPIDAVVTSVREDRCGNHGRYLCYRLELRGSLDGIEHKYSTVDVPHGHFVYAKGKDGPYAVSPRHVQILVVPHPGNVEFSTMYWNREDPLDEFGGGSFFLIVVIAVAIGIAPLGMRATRKKQEAGTTPSQWD